MRIIDLSLAEPPFLGFGQQSWLQQEPRYLFFQLKLSHVHQFFILWLPRFGFCKPSKFGE